MKSNEIVPNFTRPPGDGASQGIAGFEELSALSTERLRSELSRAMELSARNLMRLALIVRALEERGEDLSDLRLGLMGYLRQIAYGQVLPEVVVRFAEAPSLVRRIAALPSPEQRQLAEGKPIRLVVKEPDGSFGHRMADPLKMSFDQVNQVFGPGRIRDEAEQILRLQERVIAEKKINPKVNGNVEVDRKRGGVRVGRTFVAAATILEALASLASEEDVSGEDIPNIPLVLKLTDQEHARLKYAALRSGNTMHTLGRRALLVTGLLSGPDPE